MRQREQIKAARRWHPPHIGQRIVKTTVAVFLCLLVYWIRGYRGQEMPTEAAITAIICMQPYVRDTGDYAINRFAGTLIGTAWGLLFLLLLLMFPAIGSRMLLLYAGMALGVMLSLYTAVLIRKPDASSLAAIVFICIVIAFPEIENPLQQTLTRILGVMLGTTVAIAVNVFRLPRTKNRDYVFFVRMKDLVPDRFAQLPAAAMFRLNYLYNDGAKICMISEHAPAFFTTQMSQTMLSVPMIVMDGAAIYDPASNEYLFEETLPPESSALLSKRLDGLGISYFIYTIHRNKVCIFHRGEVREQEKILYDRLRRSPYRSYLEGEIYEPEEIVYFKIIDEPRQIEELRRVLKGLVNHHGLREAVRPQTAAENMMGLYLYSGRASVKRAEERLMEHLRETDPALKPVEVFLKGGYQSEHDAMQLLHTLSNCYEPVRFFRRRER